MEAMQQIIQSKAILDDIIDSVLKYYAIFSPKGTSFEPIIDYKRKQVYSLLDGKYDISCQELMMLLSCPLDIERKEDIRTFGIRAEEFPQNGKLNLALSESILYNAILESMNDPELEDKPVTLPTKYETLKFYSESMLGNPSLLIYLFMTGKAKEFTEAHGDVDFLKRLDGVDYSENELVDRITKLEKSDDLDPEYKEMYYNDLGFIKSKLTTEIVDIVPTVANKILKGA